MRKVVQLAALGLFLFLFFESIYSIHPGRDNLFYRLDPLTGITAMLAGRTWIPGLALGGVTLLATFLLGRVWCGWFCPLGTILQIFSPKTIRRTPPDESWRKLKYILLFLILFGALFANNTLAFLDPLTLLNRSLSTAFWPALRAAVMQSENFLYQFQFLWGALDEFHQAISYPLFKESAAVFSAALPILLLFLGLVGLNFLAERFWCRYLCPLGGLLGLLSKYALHRRVVDPSCTGCAACSRECPVGTIDANNGYKSDPSECVVCYDCIARCAGKKVSFQWQRPDLLNSESYAYDPGRRAVLVSLGAAAAGAAIAGIEPVRKRIPPLLLQPPGAEIPDFYSLCIRCGQCIQVCPTQGLQPALLEAGWQNSMTPHLVPRLGYCVLNCTACLDICPSGAIQSMSLEEKQVWKIGLARIDRDRCLPWAYGTPCIVCQEACPVPDKAIGLQEVELENSSGERMTIQQPNVIKDLCIGCGICEYLCPLGGEAAIRVYASADELLI